jgi:hypothetical protein
VKSQLQQPFVKNLINECAKSENHQTRDVAQWTKEVSEIEGFFLMQADSEQDLRLVL